MRKLLLFIFVVVTSPISQWMAYDFVFYWSPFFLTSSTSLEILVLSSFVLLALLVFVLYALVAASRFKERRAYGGHVFVSKSASFFYYVFFPLLALASLAYVLTSIYGKADFSLLIKGSSDFYYRSKGESAIFYYFALVSAFFSVFYFSFSRFRVISLAFFIASLVVLALWAGRTPLLVVLFVAIIIYVSVCRRVYVIYWLPFVVVFMAGSFVYLSVVRSGSEDFSEYTSGAAFAYDFDSLKYYEMSKDYRQSGGDQYFMNFQDLILFVPRAIYPDKPISTAESRNVWPEWFDGRFTNITFGAYGNLVNNFGLIGLALVPILAVLVLVLSVRYFNLVFYGQYSFAVLFLVVTFPYLMRGGFVNHRMIPLFVIVAFSHYLFEWLRKQRFVFR